MTRRKKKEGRNVYILFTDAQTNKQIIDEIFIE